ncbi:helix-turn-helix transcriptional regulator [Arsenophonus nasoniae]|uniref:Helix-turn-helix transcriptional regulator n=1 Tax=Arsenophonus nasoniae TaxID=638 RepID=A0AA95GSH5_9GAMM|nr:helix-turn-helix transcriptional regulator [Arsenophonus nasoniae]WGM04078.1 helix-turn-helix transcriptional regulator [Arsenophonus nasoniae]
MRMFDLTNVAELHDVFPELTPAQFETAILFCLGLSQGEIAHLRSVSYPAIKQTLEDIKIKLDFYSLNSLLAMFQVPLFIFVLEKCKVEYRKN